MRWTTVRLSRNRGTIARTQILLAGGDHQTYYASSAINVATSASLAAQHWKLAGVLQGTAYASALNHGRQVK